MFHIVMRPSIARAADGVGAGVGGPLGGPATNFDSTPDQDMGFSLGVAVDTPPDESVPSFDIAMGPGTVNNAPATAAPPSAPAVPSFPE